MALITESVLGTTPGAGNFKTVRYVSESLSGSPETTESEQIRSDRLASGQVLTGITLGGDIAFELAKDTTLDLLIESAMHSTFSTHVAISVDMDTNATTKTITRASGSWTTDGIVVGDVLTLAGFTGAENNVQVMVAEVTSATVIKYLGPDTMTTDAASTGTTFKKADKIAIGTTQKSFSIEKKFEDLTTKALIYKGMLVNQMQLSVAYGEILKGSFGLSGTKYLQADAAIEMITNLRTVDAPATTNSLNGSVDMPFIGTDLSGVLSESGFCIQAVDFTLNNNMTPQNCIGELTSVAYSSGTARLEITISAYLADSNWELLAKKLDQTPMAIGFQVKNADGWYAVYMPALQLSFPDPSVAGADQDIVLSMAGVGKVGAAGESTLYIMRS